MLRAFLVVGLTAVISSTPSFAVRITKLEIPATHILTNEDHTDSLILDCQYDEYENETGLVLKWFLNGNQIYQWIPNNLPFPLGLMKTSIDKTYSISENKNEKYRALSITNPTRDMAGDYKCYVQTFQTSDERTGRLQIIVPESQFEVDTKFDSIDDDINVECNVQNVYPKPQLSLTFNNEPIEGFENTKEDENGLFDSKIVVEIPRRQIETPAIILCKLEIPGTDYSKQVEKIVEDDDVEDPLDPTSSSSLETHEELTDNSASSSSIFLSLNLIMLVLAVS